MRSRRRPPPLPDAGRPASPRTPAGRVRAGIAVRRTAALLGGLRPPVVRRTSGGTATVSAAVVLLALVALLSAPGALAGQTPRSPADSSGGAPPSLADTVEMRAVVLPDLHVEVDRPARAGKLRGFDRRRRHHPAGRFIGREEIEGRDPRRLTDLLVDVPGLRLGRPAAGVGRRPVGAQRRGRAPGRPSCRVRYYVDGVHLPEASRFALDELSSEDVAGIEIYRGASEVPVRFSRRRDSCGVIVVWTRDPGEERDATP